MNSEERRLAVKAANIAVKAAKILFVDDEPDAVERSFEDAKSEVGMDEVPGPNMANTVDLRQNSPPAPFTILLT